MTPSFCVRDIGDLFGCTYCGEKNRAWWIHGEPRCFEHSNLQPTNYAYRWFKKSCEPRRWLPQRWIACGEKLPVMSVERMISMQHERNAYMIGSWVVRKYDYGTCKPCVGPVCEVGE